MGRCHLLSPPPYGLSPGAAGGRSSRLLLRPVPCCPRWLLTCGAVVAPGGAIGALRSSPFDCRPRLFVGPCDMARRSLMRPLLAGWLAGRDCPCLAPAACSPCLCSLCSLRVCGDVLRVGSCYTGGLSALSLLSHSLFCLFWFGATTAPRFGFASLCARFPPFSMCDSDLIPPLLLLRRRTCPRPRPHRASWAELNVWALTTI